MRILVTGGAGFIGSAVTDAYLAAGHDVAVVDDPSSGSAEHLDPRARLYRLDVRASALDEVLAEEEGLRRTWEWFAARAAGEAEVA